MRSIPQAFPEKNRVAQCLLISCPYPFLVEMKRLTDLGNGGYGPKMKVSFILCSHKHKNGVYIGLASRKDYSRLAADEKNVENILSFHNNVRYGQPRAYDGAAFLLPVLQQF